MFTPALGTFVLASGAVVLSLFLPDIVYAADDPLLPRLECGSPVPKGIRQFNFPTHTEIVGDVETEFPPLTDLQDGTLRKRFVDIKVSDCWISFYTFSFLSNEARLPSTGSFDDLFSNPFQRARNLLAIPDNIGLLVALSDDFANCRNRYMQSVEKIAAGAESEAASEEELLAVVEKEGLACQAKAIDALNARGFVGAWESGNTLRTHAFTVVDGKFRLWFEE